MRGGSYVHIKSVENLWQGVSCQHNSKQLQVSMKHIVINRIKNKIIINIWKKDLILFLFLFLLLFLSFRFNSLNVVGRGLFYAHQRDSDALVIDRLVAGSIGITDSYFLGWTPDHWKIEKKRPSVTDEDLIRYANQGFNRFFIYKNNVGLSRVILNPFWNITIQIFKDNPNRFVYGFRVIKTITSLINAFVISLFFLWIIKEFPIKFLSIFPLISLYCQDWVTIFGKSVYWQMWSWFAPMVFNFYFLRYIFECRKVNISIFQNTLLYSINFILIYLKCLMGYEYISTIIFSLILPFIYYAIKFSFELKNKFNILRSMLFILITTGVFSFVSSLLTHYIILQMEFHEPWKILKTMILKSTYAVGGLSSIPNIYHIRLESNTMDVVFRYLMGGNMSELFLLLICSLFIYAAWRKNMFRDDRKCFSLFVTMLFSIIGSMSWYVLAKGHSYEHPHMNYVLWYLPLNYFIYIFILYVLNPLFDKLSRIRMSSD